MTEEKTQQRIDDSLQRLERLVQELKEKDVTIDESLKKFDEGKELVKYIQKHLSQAENRFEKLKAELSEQQEEEAGDSRSE